MTVDVTAHHSDTTPGDTFGGLGVDGLDEYHEEDVAEEHWQREHPLRRVEERWKRWLSSTVRERKR